MEWKLSVDASKSTSLQSIDKESMHYCKAIIANPFPLITTNFEISNYNQCVHFGCVGCLFFNLLLVGVLVGGFAKLIKFCRFIRVDARRPGVGALDSAATSGLAPASVPSTIAWPIGATILRSCLRRLGGGAASSGALSVGCCSAWLGAGLPPAAHALALASIVVAVSLSPAAGATFVAADDFFLSARFRVSQLVMELAGSVRPRLVSSTMISV